jgi:hypothetical protein
MVVMEALVTGPMASPYTKARGNMVNVRELHV